MKTIVVSDFKIIIKDKKTYISNKAISIIRRYFYAFGRLTLVTRETEGTIDDNWFDASDYLANCITFKKWNEFYGFRFRKILKNAIKESDIVIGRFSSLAALRASAYAKRYKKTFVAEIMSDAWDSLWNHSIKGKLIAPVSFFLTKRAIKRSNYALYVTESFLQKRYPCFGESLSASNVFISDVENNVLDKRISKIESFSLNEIKFITVGAVSVKFKGQQYMIKSIPLFNKVGINVKYYIVGEGSSRYLKKVVKKYGVSNQVFFMGRKTPSEVCSLIDDCDIYVQPSLQEGLPRAVIEAMSRGCPCFGAKTGGIPELLDLNATFPRKSPKGIFNSIMNMLNRSDLVALSKRNFKRSKHYISEILDSKRDAFLKMIVNDWNISHKQVTK